MSLSVEDRLDIHDLYMRYTHAIDRADGAAWAACFTPDGSLEIPYRSQVTAGSEAFHAVADSYGARSGGYTRHVTTNVAFREQAGLVIGEAYLLMLRGGWEAAAPVMEMSGRYDDEIVRLDDRWVFRRRVLTVDTRPA
ncbi:nuclear transport factor 2 family protein [Microbacterium sp. RD1]|uniref:nuclear transport factor 2 family protein n=1 Tax=Microbacterium sp. RD1 TaxID=3457313 RepID=UPI003FA5A87F